MLQVLVLSSSDFPTAGDLMNMILLQLYFILMTKK